MPRTRASAVFTEAAEAVMPTEPEEQVELDEFEEIEEVEYEEIEEEVEELEEEALDGVVEEKNATALTNDAHAKENVTVARDDAMKEDGMELEDESKKHAELLALPPHGSEVYVGGIPPDATEEELRSFCEAAGDVTEVRMMKVKDSSENKGYCFVTFRTKEMATTAIEKLNNIEFKGNRIKCSGSQAKHRLFIGNVPRNWAEDELKRAVLEVGPGVISVDLMKDPPNSTRNRGFAFIEFYNHACADYSRKKMFNPKFKLDSNSPTVSWADPKSGNASSQIKSVYVKNLPKDTSEDQLKKLFEHHGEITKVVLPPAKPGQEKRFGFVHFTERSSTMKALNNNEKYEINGEVLECSLAKPPAVQKPESVYSAQKSALLPNYTARAGFDIIGGAYGALAPGFAPSMMYGRRQTPTSMAMMPMILPDGRIGYVLQQPGVPVSPLQYGGSSSSSGKKGSENNRGRRYNPY